MYALESHRLTFCYFEKSKRLILNDSNFNLRAGKITVLVGKSGCGKSTLAHLLVGLLPKHGGFLLNGCIKINEIDIHCLSPSERAKEISMMFQNPDLQFCMNHLFDELVFCLENICTPKDQIRAIIDEKVRLTKCEDILYQPFSTLSGGQKQRAALCCILAIGSKILVLDEPFANLDYDLTIELIHLLHDLNKKLKLTILVIDHHPTHWYGIANQLVILEDQGKIYQEDQFEKLIKAYQQTLKIPVLSPPAERFSNILCISATVNKLFKIEAQIEEGSITAIVGPSGCGKTTLLKSLVGLVPYEGMIQLENRSIHKIKKRHLLKKIGFVFQNPMNQFISQSTIEEIIKSLKIWHKNRNSEWYTPEAMRLLKIFKLDCYANLSPYMLSQGQQRRLSVLSMIASGQRILLLDEPTYGQDLESTLSIIQLLNEQVIKNSLTIIYTTHDETLAKQWSHQIIRYKNGRFSC